MRCDFHARNIHSLGGAYFLKTVLKHQNFFSVESVRRDCRPAPRFPLADFGNDVLKGPTNHNDFWALLHINANV